MFKPFSEAEFEVIGMHKCGASAMMDNMGAPSIPTEPLFNRPISAKENFKLYFTPGEKPCWQPQAGWMFCDVNNFRPRIIADNVATRLVFDGENSMDYPSLTAKGWFDLEWIYVPVAGGATVKPGNPKLEDMNDWEEVLTFPDLDALDWSASGKANEEYLKTPQLNQLAMLDGFWERLISLMDVEGAAIALIDEDQEEALHSFFDKYCDFLIDYVRHAKQVYDIDCVLIHDDWGHQKGGFFSLETAMDKLVPYYKRLTDAVHEMGMFFELHSCGKNEDLVPAYIAAGFDWWAPQPINNVDMLSEKYKDANFTFACQTIGLMPGADEEEQIRVATEWFEKYKDRHVISAFMDATPLVNNTIYKLSREYFAK